ncbi:hypothetical protein PR202_ga09813 [Eleusine coracana subsp. coracana]|uniref:Protein kinase domain-containing protein n=1 Tax=Eleusine coracana subsp. coracana TaxID=191504 RepID=A0AAV5C3U4_ELECO|nr:hypothetical protein PR202_ga09813 [Eleusine coracana subsp. coracana]
MGRTKEAPRCRAEDGGGEVSLREWLDRPGRAVEAAECVHVFRQVAEAVAVAHAQGVAVGSARPSCFVVSPPFARVAFIESASGSDASGGSCSGSDASDDADPDASPPRRGDGGAASGEDRAAKGFPLRSVLAMELTWYTSPEESDDSGATFASDVYRLGVLLFELFCTFETMEEKMRAMANLRHRVLPPQLLLKWPKEASFCQLLMHPVPETRPKMSEVLQSEFLNQSRNNLEEREAALRLREEIEEQELLLDFLQQLQKRKQDIADNLQDTVAFLSSDINEVLYQQSALGHCGNFSSDLDKEVCSETVEDQSDCGSRKRFRPEMQGVDAEEQNRSLEEGSRTVPSSVVWDVTRSQVFVEMREHERRVWSVDFSTVDPTKLAGSVGTIRTRANVCSVQFQSDSARSIAIGSADHKIYCYDLRNIRAPYCTLVGHSKTFTYLRPFDQNFVGLSISDGYIATGSETNEVFVYHKDFPMPVLAYKFSVTDPISGQDIDDPSQFISCVCWRGQSSTLLSANSSGNIKILEMD